MMRNNILENSLVYPILFSVAVFVIGCSSSKPVAQEAPPASSNKASDKDSASTEKNNSGSNSSPSNVLDANANANANADSSSNTNTSDLVGVWSSCFAWDGPPVVIKATKVVQEFKSAGELIVKISHYSDTTCKVAATSSNVNTFVQAVKKEMESSGDTWNAEVEKNVRSDATNATIANTYKTGKKISTNLFEIDITDKQSSKTSYLAYKMTGNSLTLTLACTQEDVEQKFCSKIAGNNASNRSTSNFDSPFTKN